MPYIALAARCLIGMVFAVSAFTKLRNGRAFRDFAAWVATLPMPLAGGGRRAIAIAVAASEVAAVVLVALPWTGGAGLLLAAVVMAAFAAGTFAVSRSNARTPCQCFGPSSVPLGTPHVVRNLALCVVAAVGAVGAGPAVTPLPGTALGVGIGVAAALPVIFLDDLLAVLTGELAGAEDDS
jgi:hypothetical protein